MLPKLQPAVFLFVMSVSAPQALPVCKVLGQPLAVCDYDSAAKWIIAAARYAGQSGQGFAVAAANTQVITMARHEADYAACLAKFSLIVPDGMPLVWVMNRRQPQRLHDRVYGPSLMLEVCKQSCSEAEVKHFLFGSTPEILQSLSSRLQHDYPGLQIAGTYSPPFCEWDEAMQRQFCAAIAASCANVVWVGLGCPKQERWIAANLDKLPPAVYLGIGAAFAFHAGKVRQAPLWIQSIGMEWLWRMCCEPRRLFKRYIKWNSLFLWYLLVCRRH